MAKAKTSITTENRSGSAADAAAKEQRTEMPLSDLHPFEGHPFKVLDDELMEQTVESIKQIGVVFVKSRRNWGFGIPVPI